MALAPKFAAHRLTFDTSNPNKHTLEFFLDYVCPFSAKMFVTLYSDVLPLIESKYSKTTTLIFRQQIQPWHPSSTLVHEAALAVLKISPGKFWEFSNALFKDHKAYFDESLFDEGRNATYKRLAALGKSVGVDEGKMYDMLKIEHGKGEAENAGNEVTNDLKVLVKMARLVGVHVSPTVIFDGVGCIVRYTATRL